MTALAMAMQAAPKVSSVRFALHLVYEKLQKKQTTLKESPHIINYKIENNSLEDNRRQYFISYG